MDKWDEARLKEVVGQKGNAATTTDIVCKVRGPDANSALELILTLPRRSTSSTPSKLVDMDGSGSVPTGVTIA